MNIGHTLYTTLVRYAEGGERVTSVVLPEHLYEEYLSEQGMPQMMRTLGVKVIPGEVIEPKFHIGEPK
jgi:hypothetical protein